MTRHSTTRTPGPARGGADGTARALVGAAVAGTTAALIGTSAIHLAATAVGLDLVVTPPGGSAAEVPLAAVVGAVVVAGVVALATALVLRRVRHGKQWFAALATLALVGSFASPVGAAEEASTAAVLSLMHVVVALCLVPVLTRKMAASNE